MMVTEHQAGDAQRLKQLIRQETRAKPRDRYRMALWAIEGREKLEIAARLHLAKSTVEQWVYRYRDQGIAALHPRQRLGAQPKLSAEQRQQFMARLKAGPRPEDQVCTLRGKDARRILEQEFGVVYTLGSVYDLLHRLNFSCLKPRPRHEKNDPAAMAQFQASAPLLSRA